MGAETIAAIATPPGRGAIAVVRLSGPNARAVGARVFHSRGALADRHATFGRIVDASGSTIDEGLALFFAAPRSYTGEDVLELHVHGSPVVARDVLLACLAAGARHAQAGEFTRRAFLAGKLDLSQAEAVADLIAAEHRSAARAAAAQLAGGLAREAQALRGELEGVLEELAAAIDFPDEVETPPAAALTARLDPVRRALGALLATAEAGRLVREGVSVAIVGPPNAGKSSLLNGLLGAERALVSEIAGTTRDTIEETSRSTASSRASSTPRGCGRAASGSKPPGSRARTRARRGAHSPRRRRRLEGARRRSAGGPAAHARAAPARALQQGGSREARVRGA